jgi:hypothetical protein
MAITDENQGQQHSNQAQAQETEQAFGGGTTFHNNGFLSAMNDGADSEYFNRFSKQAQEILKNHESPFDIALIGAERKNHTELVFDYLIVATRAKNNKGGLVSYHTLILEATGPVLDPIKRPIGGQMIEEDRYTSAAVDQVYVKIAQDKIFKAFDTNKAYMVDATVVPRGFNPDDRDAVKRVLANAANAGSTEIQVHSPNYRGLNLAHLERNVQLSIEQSFNRQTLQDAVNNPVRSDILIAFGSKLNEQGQQQNSGAVNNGGKQVKVSQLSGFIDLVYLDPQDMPQPAVPYGYAAPPEPTQRFAPRLVITDLATGMYNEPSAVLLALASANTLNDISLGGGIAWWQSFKPTSRNSNAIDLNDIGAINYDVNLEKNPSGFGAIIDTKSDSFDLPALGTLLRAAVYPGMVISLDVPDYGPQSWYLSVFAAAASGGQKAAAAYDAIFNAANSLTNGIFEKHFPHGTPMFTDLGNRVHLGYWVDSNGNKRDLRDIDHLAVCNLAGARNPGLIRDWSDTFLRGNEFPLLQRLQGRKKLISGFTHESAEFTNMATRVTPTKAFMSALAQAVLATNVPVKVSSQAQASEFNNRRGSAGFIGEALINPTASFYQSSAGQAGMQYGHGGPGSYRW